MAHSQTILITGATSGIGRYQALRLAAAGHRVFAIGREQIALDALQTEGAGKELRLETVLLDVTNSASIAAARDEVGRRTSGKGLDVLINNAGYALYGPLEVLSNDSNSEGEKAQPMIYQIRIRGHQGSHWTDWFSGLTITALDNGKTLFIGAVIDQSALHGVLRKGLI